MWFGTQYGLKRYDGHNFKVFVSRSKKSQQPQRRVSKRPFQGSRWGTSVAIRHRFLNKIRAGDRDVRTVPGPGRQTR